MQSECSVLSFQMLQWKSNTYYIFWVYVCVFCNLRYTACKANAPYSHFKCCSGKAIRITYSECMCVFFVALGIQHAKRMLRTVISNIAVEKQYLLHILSICVCFCILRYTAHNAHAPCCHLWPVRLSNIFQYYLLNGMIFEDVIGCKMCILTFSTCSVWNISHSKKD